MPEQLQRAMAAEAEAAREARAKVEMFLVMMVKVGVDDGDDGGDDGGEITPRQSVSIIKKLKNFQRCAHLMTRSSLRLPRNFMFSLYNVLATKACFCSPNKCN